jgi:hypothetical protein
MECEKQLMKNNETVFLQFLTSTIQEISIDTLSFISELDTIEVKSSFQMPQLRIWGACNSQRLVDCRRLEIPVETQFILPVIIKTESNFLKLFPAIHFKF